MNIQELLDEVEVLKEEHGNKSAGTRARRSCQIIKTMFRKSVHTFKA